ncbi:MAG TPA: sigma-70 family RNA polymerase sigma factor [Flavipsychrobacter sp.]|nr:sigma-70 family RNA polymerase sigma factor [Flavipsychrobacter sp.]
MAVYAEQEIIKGCLRKDRVYEEHLYKQYYSMFLAICMRYAKDVQNAKQLLNDGFVKIFMSIGSFRNEGSFEGWMRKIIVNTCLEYLKSSDFKKNSQTVHTDVIDEKESMVVYNEAQKNIDAHELIAMLQALPPVTRVVFNLFAFEGYNHNEIAAMLNISIGTSSWHVHNARSILQRKIMVKNKLYEHK